jgi:hypothetical protein
LDGKKNAYKQGDSARAKIANARFYSVQLTYCIQPPLIPSGKEYWAGGKLSEQNHPQFLCFM